MCRWLTNASLTRRSLRGDRGAELAKVEQQDAALEHEVDVDAGIAERRVHEMRIETARHGDLHLKSVSVQDA
jgi:hypothetical protein